MQKIASLVVVDGHGKRAKRAFSATKNPAISGGVSLILLCSD
jgi:hypothetical protein